MSQLLGVIFFIAAIVLAYLYISMKIHVSQQVQDEVIRWRDRELESQKAHIFEVARIDAMAQFELWKATHEAELRRDAIQRSQAVTIGKVTEHIVPYLPGFRFNPKDVRFLGTPIDLVVFDGLDDGEVKKIVFVEVKTGTSALSGRERLVRQAVKARNVEWLEFRPNVQNQGSGSMVTAVVSPTASIPSTPSQPRKWWWQ